MLTVFEDIHTVYFTHILTHWNCNKKYMEWVPTISVTPLPDKLSASNFVSLLSRYGMCPFFFPSLSWAMQYPVKENFVIVCVYLVKALQWRKRISDFESTL